MSLVLGLIIAPIGFGLLAAGVSLGWAYGTQSDDVEVFDLVAENDRVVVRYMERGNQTGDFMGLPPTGRSYEKHGSAVHRVANGRLAECWLQEDDQGYQQQLFS